MKKAILLTLAAAFVSVACNKEMGNVNSENDKNLGGQTVTITASRSEMKTAIDSETGIVTWTVGDKLKLVCTDGTAIETSAVEQAGVTAEFTATIPDGKELGWAVYPCGAQAQVSGGNLVVSVPFVQDGLFANASIETGAVVDNNVTLKNECALIRFEIPAEVEAAKVLLGGNGASLTGDINVASGAVANAKSLVQINVAGAGTYYAAVAPAIINGPIVQIYAADNTLLGERISTKVLNAQKGHVLPISFGEEIKTYAEKRFITPDGAGTKDGSSWENAWSYSNLRGKISNVTANGGVRLWDHMLFVQGGTITISSLITLYNDTKFHVYGGYPTGLTGQDIVNRDVKNNPTIFNGGNTQRIFNISTKGTNVSFDGVEFRNSTQASGDANQYTGCCILMNQGVFSFTNCVFDGNRKTVGGAILRIGNYTAVDPASANVTFDRCVFSNNYTATKGQISLGHGGKVTVKDCDFTLNNVSGDNDPRIIYCIWNGATVTDVEIVDAGGNTFAEGQRLKP